MNYFKKLETIVILVVILVLGIAYGFLQGKKDINNQASNNQSGSELSQLPEEPVNFQVKYNGVEGKNALELLKANYQVETKTFGDLGEFVQSIDGRDADSSQFWSFYVNGVQSQVGAGTYITKSSDTIEWKLEEIK